MAPRDRHSLNNTNSSNITIQIMTCSHCAENQRNSLSVTDWATYITLSCGVTPVLQQCFTQGAWSRSASCFRGSAQHPQARVGSAQAACAPAWPPGGRPARPGPRPDSTSCRSWPLSWRNLWSPSRHLSSQKEAYQWSTAIAFFFFFFFYKPMWQLQGGESGSRKPGRRSL